MWKNTFITAAIALSLSACATQPAAQSPPAAASTATQNAGGCGPHTLSSGLIVNNCTSPGSTYTQEDLRRTGEGGNLGNALSQLDPSVSVTPRH
jgi:hypothetical protein